MKRSRQEAELPARDEIESIGLALSGGGSRAIAFQLGCMRALNSAGLLPKVRVISCISGGSVLGAMYAYSGDDFASFDARVTALLSRGLMKSGLRVALTSPAGMLAIVSALRMLLWQVVRGVLAPIRLVASRMGVDMRLELKRPRRMASRTTILQATLAQVLFGATRITDVRREGLDIVINATELQTGSAFRFGSRESGCWRFGRLAKNEVEVAKAVAASAAFPLVLPALEEHWDFVTSDGKAASRLVVLSDGAIYDNLGVTPLWPGRERAVSVNVFNVSHIVCCSAGEGLRSSVAQVHLPGRLALSFAAVLDRVQNESMNRLHRLKESGEIRGFLLPFLGQRDERLPSRPSDLVPRETVNTYPATFNAMPEWAIAALTKRGEQLTRLHLAEYFEVTPDDSD